MHVILLSLLMLFLLSFLGYGLFSILQPNRVVKYNFSTYPVFGLILIVILYFNLELAKIPMLIANSIILLVGIFFMTVSLVLKKGQAINLHKGLICLALFVFFLIFYYFSQASLSYNYYHLSEYYATKIPLSSEIYEQPSKIYQLSQQGTKIVLRYFSSFFKINIQTSYFALIPVFLLSLSAQINFVINSLLKIKRKLLSIGLGLIFLLGLYLLVLIGKINLEYIISANLALSTLIVFKSYLIKIINVSSKKMAWDRYDVIIALQLAALSLISHTLFKLVGLIIIILTGYFLLKKRKASLVIITLLKIILITILINPIAFSAALKIVKF